MPDKLNHYLTTWNLSDPQPLARTVTSHLYTVTSDGTRVVLKLLTDLGAIDERIGAEALRCFDGHGAVRLLRSDPQAHLLEYADGEHLIALVERGEDARATAIIGDVLNSLHGACIDPPPGELRPVRRWFRDLFRQADKDRRAGTSSVFTRAAPIAEALLDDPREVRVLHGDIHHENIRYHAQRGWLAFDPKGLVGERTYDAANTLCNPWNMPDVVENKSRLLNQAGILAEKLGIDLSRVLAFTYVYACLSASWSLGDGMDAAHTLRIAELVEPHVRR